MERKPVLPEKRRWVAGVREQGARKEQSEASPADRIGGHCQEHGRAQAVSPFPGERPAAPDGKDAQPEKGVGEHRLHAGLVEKGIDDGPGTLGHLGGVRERGIALVQVG